MFLNSTRITLDMKSTFLSKGISVIVATKNEEKNISECLESVKWADEIIVIDMLSSDKTRDIAKKYTNKIFNSDGGSFQSVPFNKNIGFKKATKEWIFVLDADERVSPLLYHEIKTKTSQNKFDGFKVYFNTYFLGKPLRCTYLYGLFHIRLFKNGQGNYSNINHHLQLNFHGKLGRLKNPIDHLYIEKINDYIKRIIIYSLADTSFFDNVMKKRKWWYYLAIRPICIFFYVFFAKKGFLDGWRGFIFSVLVSFYYFAERANVWERKWKKNKSLNKSY